MRFILLYEVKGKQKQCGERGRRNSTEKQCGETVKNIRAENCLKQDERIQGKARCPGTLPASPHCFSALFLWHLIILLSFHPASDNLIVLQTTFPTNNNFKILYLWFNSEICATL